MKSLILLEVEHGEDTDALVKAIAQCVVAIDTSEDRITVNDYGVRVDLPACFVLDCDMPNTPTIYKAMGATL